MTAAHLLLLIESVILDRCTDDDSAIHRAFQDVARGLRERAMEMDSAALDGVVLTKEEWSDILIAGNHAASALIARGIDPPRAHDARIYPTIDKDLLVIWRTIMRLRDRARLGAKAMEIEREDDGR